MTAQSGPIKYRRFDPLNEDDVAEGPAPDTIPEIEAIFRDSPHVRRVTIETTCTRIEHPDTPYGYTFVYEREDADAG